MAVLWGDVFSRLTNSGAQAILCSESFLAHMIQHELGCGLVKIWLRYNVKNNLVPVDQGLQITFGGIGIGGTGDQEPPPFDIVAPTVSLGGEIVQPFIAIY